jgi:hypothetical protein
MNLRTKKKFKKIHNLIENKIELIVFNSISLIIVIVILAVSIPVE